MATTPHPQPPPKPQTPPAPPPKPPEPKPEAARTAEPLVIGARPSDPHDPQAAKFEAHAAPPRWDDPKTAKPAKDAPRWLDGPPIADVQREQSALIEKEGVEKFLESLDQRSVEDRPKFLKDALAGGGAYVSAGAQKQVAGVAPPTKRE